MKFISFLLCIFLTLSLKAQDTSVPNEYMIYFTDGTTQAEVIAIGNEWNSNVLMNIQPNVTNVALYSFYGSFPMTNPYDPTQSVNSLLEIVGKIIKQKPKGDGGGLNYYIGGIIPGEITGACYNENLLSADTDDDAIVSVAVFDTGTNWDAANLIGYNFGTPFEINGDATDKNGHGTHVASLVNKTYLYTNNGSTTTQVNYIFGNPLGGNGQGTLADMVLSMENAILHGANVINCSFSYFGSNLEFGLPGLGPPGTNGPHIGEEDPLYLLMSSANPTRTLFVASAGNNNGFDLDGTADYNVYPAAFPLENMITVASHSCLANLSSFSNLGDKSVDIAAPGENILSIDHEMDQVYYTGTSQAAAFVSGAAVILGTHQPGFDATAVKCAIMNSASYRPSLAGLLVSEGILDIPRAVIQLQNNPACNPLMRISQPEIDADVSINPTIVTSVIDITFSLKADGPVKIALYNLNGQTLYTKTQSASKGVNEISVNLDNLPTDNFMLVRIETNEFAKTSKIIRVQ